jgi:hypothetical protein
MARLPGVDRPVLQIMAASQGTPTWRAAQALGQAAACRFGRTLLVSCRNEPLSGPSPSALIQEPLRPRRGTGRGIIPDVVTEGLHHTHLACEPASALKQAIENWLAAPQHFRMLAIESLALCVDPCAVAMAARCHGTILAVQAGVTRLDEIRACVRQLSSAGALLIGTVLVEAPRTAFWERGRAA